MVSIKITDCGEQNSPQPVKRKIHLSEICSGEILPSKFSLEQIHVCAIYLLYNLKCFTLLKNIVMISEPLLLFLCYFSFQLISCNFPAKGPSFMSSAAETGKAAILG